MNIEESLLKIEAVADIIQRIGLPVEDIKSLIELFQEEFIRSEKLAKRLDIPVYSIRKFVREGKLPAYKLSNYYLFDCKEVCDIIRRNRVGSENILN